MANVPYKIGQVSEFRIAWVFFSLPVLKKGNQILFVGSIFHAFFLCWISVGKKWAPFCVILIPLLQSPVKCKVKFSNRCKWYLLRIYLGRRNKKLKKKKGIFLSLFSLRACQIARPHYFQVAAWKKSQISPQIVFFSHPRVTSFFLSFSLLLPPNLVLPHVTKRMRLAAKKVPLKRRLVIILLMFISLSFSKDNLCFHANFDLIN